MNNYIIDPVSPAPILRTILDKNGYDLDIHPGLGCVTLCRNGVEFKKDEADKRKLNWYQSIIKREALPHKPTPVWTLHIDDPFRSLIYAFTSDRYWVLIDTKEGFA
jgi:hypothetical protein